MHHHEPVVDETRRDLLGTDDLAAYRETVAAKQAESQARGRQRLVVVGIGLGLVLVILAVLFLTHVIRV
jgi:hypothetical protein